MKLRNARPEILQAAAALLEPYCDGLTGETLADAIRDYQPPFELAPLPLSPLVTRKEAAYVLRLHENTIDRMLNDGRLTRYKIGRAVRCSRAEIEKILDNRPAL